MFLHIHVNVQKHFFLLLLLYQSLDFTRSRLLQTFNKSHYVLILNCLNIFDITILFIISGPRLRK